MERLGRCLALFALMGCAAWGQQAAPETPKPLDTAQACVEKGDWSGAIDAYAAYLRGLTTRDYRDKKTFAWILEAFEKQAPDGKPDYEAFKQVIRGKLPKYRGEKGDSIQVWRLHLLLADIARRQNNPDEAAKETGIAIDWYPETAYGDPATQSRLQHLYNEAALARAQADPAAGETYLLDKLLRDQRFDFAYLPPWRAFYETKGDPAAYPAFVRKVIDTYDQKIKRYPAKSDMLTHYRKLTEEELATAPNQP
jgi:hypothetical protein